MTPDTPTTFGDALERLRPRPRAFVRAYLETLNKTEAARRAGYSKTSARQQGHRMMTNADIRAAIELGLEQYTMGRFEVLARVQDVATGSMADFLTLEEVEYRERVPVPAFERREQLRAQVAEARERMESVKDKKRLQAWQTIIDASLDEIERLPENPLETVTVDGPVRKAVVARVDLVKAEAAGKLHLIRKVKQTERGLEVELYDAMNALELLGKHHKLWTDRVALENQDGTPLVLGVTVVAAPPRDLEGLES